MAKRMILRCKTCDLTIAVKRMTSELPELPTMFHCRTIVLHIMNGHEMERKIVDT